MVVKNVRKNDGKLNFEVFNLNLKHSLLDKHNSSVYARTLKDSINY